MPSAVAGTKIAIKAVCYYNTGSYGSPTWAAMMSVLEVDLGSDWEYADASSRGSRAKLYGKTMIDLPCSLNMKADDVAADYQAMLTAAFSDTPTDMLILDGPLSEVNAFGYRIPALIGGTPQDQGAGNAIYTKFPIKPGYTSNYYPSYVYSTGSTITATAL
jgi:hypothetical protein